MNLVEQCISVMYLLLYCILLIKRYGLIVLVETQFDLSLKKHNHNEKTERKKGQH